MSTEPAKEPTRDDVLAIAIEAATDAVDHDDPSVADAEVSESTILIGDGAVVDSLGLVQIITDVEDTVSERYGRDLDLTDERALSQKHSPFRSVAALVDHVMDYVASSSPAR
jgi:acyl carrier protein